MNAMRWWMIKTYLNIPHGQDRRFRADATMPRGRRMDRRRRSRTLSLHALCNCNLPTRPLQLQPSLIVVVIAWACADETRTKGWQADWLKNAIKHPSISQHPLQPHRPLIGLGKSARQSKNMSVVFVWLWSLFVFLWCDEGFLYSSVQILCHYLYYVKMTLWQRMELNSYVYFLVIT
jgi:hypothetical protein